MGGQPPLGAPGLVWKWAGVSSRDPACQRPGAPAPRLPPRVLGCEAMGTSLHPGRPDHGTRGHGKDTASQSRAGLALPSQAPTPTPGTYPSCLIPPLSIRPAPAPIPSPPGRPLPTGDSEDARPKLQLNGARCGCRESRDLDLPTPRSEPLKSAAGTTTQAHPRHPRRAPRTQHRPSRGSTKARVPETQRPLLAVPLCRA